jgi:hypothetical protein
MFIARTGIPQRAADAIRLICLIRIIVLLGG